MAPRARSFSFVHAADLHLDTPFSGVHAVAPLVATALRDASLAAFDTIVEVALAREVAFVLFAGDIYDGAERGFAPQLHFRDGLARLSAAGIASFVVHGNHDPVESGWSALRDSWPEKVTIFGCDEVVVVPVICDGVQLATVQGISYAQREMTENLAKRFTRPQGEGVHIGLLHCNVEGASGAHANYAPCTLDDLRATGLDYLALGHVHERRLLAKGSGPGDPWVVYPGNTQARSPRPSERGAKGALVVEVRDGVVAEPEFFACDRVRFTDLAVDIGDLGDLGDLESDLREMAEGAAKESEGRSLVLRVTFEGRGELHDDLARPGVLDELLTHLREHAARQLRPSSGGTPSVTRAPRLTEEVPGRGDFIADLLQVAGLLDDDTLLLGTLAELAREAPRALQRPIDELLADGERRDNLRDAARRIALSELGGQR